MIYCVLRCARVVEVEANSSPIIIGSRGHSFRNVPEPHLFL